LDKKTDVNFSKFRQKNHRFQDLEGISDLEHPNIWIFEHIWTGSQITAVTQWKSQLKLEK
jgi:hypothetical protein